MSVNKKYMDLYLQEVYKKFIAIKDDDYKKSQEVFKVVFNEVKKMMGEHCKYFSKYSNQVLYAGSVSDGIKVSKLDEFDMDIVIRLPINYDQNDNGIILENDQPGFVKMKITNAFDNLDKQPDWELRHKVTRDWRDAEKYFLQNKFRAWMHGIVQKAVNELKGEVKVNNDLYLLTYKQSGPAFTLNVRNGEGVEPFVLDVDLVPVIRFSHPRWPEGYRQVEGTKSRDWLVVPKPNKVMEEAQQNRCWRLSFQDFERDLMKDCQQLKMIIRLVKKLRDALKLKAIASYYIKTLFLWRIVKENDRQFWQNRSGVLFQAMVEDLHDAIAKKDIPYFWNEKHNLIESMKPSHQKLYAEKLLEVVNSLKAGDVERVVTFLLTEEELKQYQESEFYKQHLALVANVPIRQQMSMRSMSCVSTSSQGSDVVDFNSPSQSDSTPKPDPSFKILISKLDKLSDKMDKMTVTLTDKIDALTDKLDALSDKVSVHERKLNRLEGDTANCGDILNLLSGRTVPESVLSNMLA